MANLKPTKEEADALAAFDAAFKALPKGCHVEIDDSDYVLRLWRRDRRYGPNVNSAGQVGPDVKLKKSQVRLC